MIKNLFVIFVCLLIFAIGGIGYVAHVQQQSNRKWCSLLQAIDVPPQPPTPQNVKVQRRIHQLSKDLGCIK